MANPGGVGSKFVSVNLNKSYGQPSNSSSRVRSVATAGSHGVGGGVGGGAGAGAGGGMVVLSRHRSSIVGVQKGGPKLSVPPPLNLPSLRKEHERFDSSTSGGGASGSGTSGTGSRPTSSGMGWSKPALSTLQEKDNSDDHPLFVRSGGGSQVVVDGGNKQQPSQDQRMGNGVYMPPSARSGTVGPPVTTPSRPVQTVEKAVVLKGEDFPSLQATLPTTTGGAGQKQHDALHQKHKQKVNEEETFNEQKDNSYSRPSFDMRPQIQSFRLTVGNGSGDNGGDGYGSRGSGAVEQSRKNDAYFPGPLPLVRLKHTSDWADDERDTGHGFSDRDRDNGYSRSESVREKEFDLPMPRTSVPNLSDGRSVRDDEAGKGSVREYTRGNTYNRDVRTPSREGRDGNAWRASPITKDGFSSREMGIDRNGVGARPSSSNREMNRENKYSGDNARDGFNSGVMAQDSRFGRRDTGYGQGGRQNGNLSVESFTGRGVEQRDRYGGDQSSRYRGNFFQNNAPKASYSMGSKGLHVIDPVFNFIKEKRSTSGKPYIEDPFLKDFVSGPSYDGRDPLTGGLVGVSKRKKDILKQADFHDPVRESFEVELERVQKIQEQERQRVVEEQARALEIARKEEEERERLVREEEERRRRVEEEAREAAWRAEQERLEAIRRTEEQRIAREEEKQRMALEEERRKEAARKKLMELEARIARRQTEVVKDDKFSAAVRDERIPGVVKEKDVPRVADVVDWDDGERMVERITSSTSSDSSNLNRSFEMGSRPSFSSGDAAFLDRGKPANSWRRDTFDHGSNTNFLLQDQDNDYRNTRRDTVGAGRSFPRKEQYGGSSVISARTSSKGGFSEPHNVDDFPHIRGHKWNLAGDGDHYGRNSEHDSEFYDNSADRFGDMGWGQGRSRGSPHASYPERLYQNFEADGFSTFGRSRHSMRQPRVLPPPSLASMHKNPLRAEIEHPGSSTYLDGEMSYHHAPRKSEPIGRTGYDGGYQERIGQPRMVDIQQDNTIPQEQKEENATSPRCDSQSSLSVSSPPHSPTHLSHDDLENSGDSPVLPTAAKGEEISLSDDENVVSVSETGKMHTVNSNTVSPVDDEEWATENDEELQEQEEYDEEEDGYSEEDEVHDGDDEHIGLSPEFEDMHLEVEEASEDRGHMVLGFDGGVEVGIPSGDEFEGTSRNEEPSVGMQRDSVGTVEEQESFDGVVGSVQSVPTENNSAEVSMESASIKVQETENAAQDLGGPGIVAYSSAASDGYNLDSVEASSSSCLPVTSMSTTMPSPIVQPIMSTVSSITSQAEVPVNLQFGLFSGPSLIPSPVPAIQIGSIQMPLHLHHQVGPSLTQMHPSQPPFFQFGQLRYAAPMSQGILPLAPQSVSFVQPTVPAHYSFNQNQETLLHNTAGQDTSTQRHISKDTVSSSLLNQQASVPKLLDLSCKNAPKEVTLLPVRQGSENESLTSQNQTQNSYQCESESRTKLLVENQGHHDIPGKKNYRYIANNKELQGQSQVESSRSQFISKAPGPMSGNKGKRFIYTVKNSGSRPPFPVSDAPNTDFSGYQRRPRQKFRRTEFRVRENVEKRQMESYSGVVENSNFHGRLSGFSARSGAKKDGSFNKPFKQTVEFEGINSESSGSRVVDHESKTEKRLGKEAPAKRLTSSLNISRSGEGNPKRNSSSVEDVDAPMQSGIVRVFRQPGIEAASDEDDFIEVRSKRQMLNDRREQREKEIKAKSRVIKASRKPRFVSQNIGVPANSSRTSTSLGGEAPPTSITSDTVVIDGRGLTKVEVPAGFTTTAATTTVVSQPLAPIGTPTVSNDAQGAMRSHSIKSLQTGPVPIVANCATNLGPGLSFDSKNAGLDNVQTSLGSWGSGRINQQVMALTQTQLDDAMKTARFDSHVACLVDHSGAVIERSKPSPSILTQEKSFSSSAGPLNSLLAGEKIQFGAVTSPTILPSSSRAPGSCRLDVSVDNSLSAVESNCTLFFEKEQHPDESCVHLDDPEAEAEAAASAVAVAAISSDENIGNGMGAGAVSASDTKSFGGPDIEGLSSGGAVVNQQLASQSRAEESLTVALPADLSVETPSLSLWPPLPSPQNSSSQMLSHFPGAPPSHFPCYEMNPMLGGPIFAFTPHDESSGTDSQSQKSNTSGSGPLGAWQQCHSGVDSFYGPPAGFTGPFISPSGGIPGVQGPPHMVVYNHFTPVGQFGQVGLSFMGTTYIPSGKQPDWKHNPAPSTMGIGEGDMNNLNVASAQRNPPNMPAPIQHLAPGSPLLPLASPFAMFDMSPFQSSSDVPVQARWSHVPASHLHSVPLSMPLQQQAEGGLPSQFSHGMPVDQSTGSRFHESCSLAPQDSRRNFPVVSDSTAQFADELGLVDPSSSTGTRVVTSRPASFSSTNGALKGQSVVAKSSPRSNTANTGIQNNSSNSTSSSQSMSSVLKNQSTHHQQNQNQQYLHPTGYTDQRGGGVSHKVGSGSDWPHRRMGFQGRNQSSGTDKNFPSIKTKQIYVAKTATSGTSTPRV